MNDEIPMPRAGNFGPGSFGSEARRRLDEWSLFVGDWPDAHAFRVAMARVIRRKFQGRFDSSLDATWVVQEFDRHPDTTDADRMLVWDTVAKSMGYELTEEDWP